MSTTTEELIVLTHAEFVRLKQDAKEAGIDLCYTAESGGPVRLDWSQRLFQDPLFQEQMERLRPADASFRVVSVQYIKKGGWFRPDQFKLAFHAAGVLQDETLQKFLTDQNVQSSSQTPKEMLGTPQ